MAKKTKKTAVFSGSDQEGMFKKLKKITKKDSFLMAITIFNPKGEPGKDLDTFFLANNFPYEDFEGTKKIIVKLIDDAKRGQAS